MRKNVIVVGMPRSGTSMAAHLFASNGYFAAKEPESELREGDEFNPMGYWEANRLIEANVELFRAVGFDHHNTWMFEPITDEQAAHIAGVAKMAKHIELVADYNVHSPWIWKDPRLCYTLGYWWPLMNQDTTAVLLLTRNVEPIFQSFLRVGWRKCAADRSEVAERVRAHLGAAEQAIVQFNIPHIKIAYEDFADRADETAQKINGFFGLEIGPQDFGFKKVLNHGSAKGRMIARMERLALWVPAGPRGLIKRFVPRNVWDWLFPGHKKS